MADGKIEFEDETHDDGYVPPEKVAVSDLMGKDADDEALNRYKQSLLQGAEEMACKTLLPSTTN